MADKDDHETIWRDFKSAVNMTASALERFLETDESQSVGQKTDGGEATGHKEGRRIVAERRLRIVAHGRGEKVTIVKFRRRKHHRKQAGHRQWFTEVKITGISA